VLLLLLLLVVLLLGCVLPRLPQSSDVLQGKCIKLKVVGAAVARH
jgi:hypothetical protein